MAGYVDFINSMLKLRDQRLEEERYEQLERMENQKQMGEMMSNMGEQFGQFAQGLGQNRMANQLMEETYGAPPRAQAVDPSMQGPADLAAQRMPGFYQGGMPELKMRMGMDEFQSKDLARQADIYSKTRDLKFKQSKWLVDRATDLKKNASHEMQQDLNNSKWYIAEKKTYLDAMDLAESPEEYEIAKDALLALGDAAQKRGMKIDPIDPDKIPPFMTAEDRAALKTQQTAVSEARTKLEAAQKAEPGWIDWTRGVLGMPEGGPYGSGQSEKEKEVQTAQELYQQEMDRLKETPGGSFYGDKPVTPKTETSGKKSGALTEARPVGTTKQVIEDATGKIVTLTWDGSKWVR